MFSAVVITMYQMVATSSSGITTFTVAWNRLAPSILAASSTSPGIDCRAPVEMMNM